MAGYRFLFRAALPAIGILAGVGVLAGACGNVHSDTTVPVTPIRGVSRTVPPDPAVPSPAETSAPASPGAGTAATTIKITAHNTAFNTSTITIPAGKKIILEMTNDDSLPHNFAVFDKKGGKELFDGTVFKGPDVTKTESFTSPSTPGKYYFQCDVHPQQMNGTLTVT